MAVVELAGVSRQFGEGEGRRLVLDRVDFQAEAGEIVLVLGPSGSGKTTLLTTLAGLTPPSSGQVRLFGRDLGGLHPDELQTLRARNIGFIFQNFLLIESLTGRENAELALRFAGWKAGPAAQRSREVFLSLGIPHLGECRAATMSHGEKQRVAAARAFGPSPGLILADEPTASLEFHQGQEVIRMLHEYIREGGRTAIVTSHDTRLAELADRVLSLQEGRLSPVAP
ncbi:MAG: ATP-binding cassette domain-containing protein [Geothrix sp.]|uniref:ABC transporter ATP-binding protein n=1 Tax=Geothrix sp. TaxID=1962974 RepID=UPI0017AFB507|nr:ATP-binding cassette domain-containing protein [Geothrix sp.]NWJ42028.1 ATP-binding cassette domain-containing protein [Geothrix sp.]WIL20004.1 MAG: ATP-binding cassette domain-containing protein [Geothrix sp.]